MIAGQFFAKALINDSGFLIYLYTFFYLQLSTTNYKCTD